MEPCLGGTLMYLFAHSFPFSLLPFPLLPLPSSSSPPLPSSSLMIVDLFYIDLDRYDVVEKTRKGLSERRSKKIFRQIVEAVNYLHINNIHILPPSSPLPSLLLFSTFLPLPLSFSLSLSSSTARIYMPQRLERGEYPLHSSLSFYFPKTENPKIEKAKNRFN